MTVTLKSRFEPWSPEYARALEAASACLDEFRDSLDTSLPGQCLLDSRLGDSAPMDLCDIIDFADAESGEELDFVARFRFYEYDSAAGIMFFEVTIPDGQNVGSEAIQSFILEVEDLTANRQAERVFALVPLNGQNEVVATLLAPAETARFMSDPLTPEAKNELLAALAALTPAP